MMMGLSRIMVAFSDPSLMRDFSSRTIGIANRECAVEPPSSSKPAMPELAGYGCGNFTLQTDGFQQKVEGKFFATTTSTLYKKGFGYWTVVLDSCHHLVEDVLLVGVCHWQHFFHLFLKAFLVIIEFCHS